MFVKLIRAGKYVRYRVYHHVSGYCFRSLKRYLFSCSVALFLHVALSVCSQNATLHHNPSLGQSLVSVGQETARDPGVAGPAIEPIHYHYEWPMAIAVSSIHRLFSNYPPGPDPMNHNYTVAELKSETTGNPYPSAE
jgi:hypothetical protein